MADIIVVGVDGSETAEKAAEAAARLATRIGAGLHVVTAFDHAETEEVRVGSDHWVFTSVEGAEQTAQNVARKVGAGISPLTTGVGEGKPHEILIDEAARVGASIIVVGNRRMQGLGRLLGSVANSVAHNAPCDVYIVKTV